MLESIQGLVNTSIDYLEHFEGNPEEVLNRYIYPNSKHCHNNSYHNMVPLVRDILHQDLMDLSVVEELQMNLKENFFRN